MLHWKKICCTFLCENCNPVCNTLSASKFLLPLQTIASQFFQLCPINASEQITYVNATFFDTNVRNIKAEFILLPIHWDKNRDPNCQKVPKGTHFGAVILFEIKMRSHTSCQEMDNIFTWVPPLLLHIFERKARPRPEESYIEFYLSTYLPSFFLSVL